MAIRFWSNPGRMIVSKPGYDAGPSLADTSKIFDSDWNFSGLIIACGRFTDPGPEPNTDPTPITIPFDDPGYVPSAIVTATGGDFNNSNPINGILNTLPLPTRIYSDHLEVLRPPAGGNNYYYRYTGINQYVVFALGTLQ